MKDKRSSHAESPKAPECKNWCLYEFGDEWCAVFDVPCIRAKELLTEGGPS